MLYIAWLLWMTGDAPEVGRPVAAVVRIATPPQVDGRLDDACWLEVPPIPELVQMNPRVGVPATEATEVRIAHDGRTLYLAIRCYDSEPDQVVATQMVRDAELSPDDRVEMWFDTFRDRRNAYFFQVSAAGSLGDALLSRGGSGFNKPWDGIWSGKTAQDELGWTAELAIPFDTLSFDPSADVWGFNLNRVVQRKLEASRFAGHKEQDSAYRMASGGDLAGLAGAQHGLGIDFAPFYAAEYVRESANDSDLRGEPGFDLFWRLSPGVQAALTINTDFAETEVDDRQVNLTRFPLFFPEKRDFFLQDAGVFEFADLGNSLVPFFSRRIGLVDGEEVPIQAGLKLTARTDEWNAGLLDVQTDGTNTGSTDLDAQNLFATRVARNIGAQSSLGFVATAGDPEGTREDALVGTDLNLRTSSFLGDKNLQGSLWGLMNSQEGSVDDGAAFGASLAYPNDVWDWRMSVREVQSNFDPALGFVPRRDVRQYSAEFTHEPRWEGLLRRSEHSIEGSLITNLDDEVQTANLEVQPLGVTFDTGDALRLELEQTRDVLDADFDIVDGISIAAGTYDFFRARIEYETSNKRAFDVSGKVEAGEYYGGTSVDTELELGWRPHRWFQGSAAWNRTDLDLDAGSAVVHVVRLKGLVSFSPELSWANFVQFDNESDEGGLNSRLRWILQPGSDLFLVWTQNMQRESGSLVIEDQAVAFKLGWTFRF